MKNVSRTVTCTVLIAGLAGVGAACTFFDSASRGSKKRVYATVFLTPTGVTATPCAAKVAPDRIQVKKNEDVDWTIIDLCGGTSNYTIDVELRWPDSSKKCGEQNSPLDPPAASGRRGITRAIDRRCRENDVFRYEVWLGGRLLTDPELEIMM